MRSSTGEEDIANKHLKCASRSASSNESERVPRREEEDEYAYLSVYLDIL